MDVIRAAVNLRLKAQSALAISLEESSYTYAQLLQSAFSISSDLKLFLSNKKQVIEKTNKGEREVGLAYGFSHSSSAKRYNIDFPRIGIIAKPSAQFVVGMWATWLCRGTAVPLALGYPNSELLHVLSDAGVSLVLGTEDHQEQLLEVSKKSLSDFYLLPQIPAFRQDESQKTNGTSYEEMLDQVNRLAAEAPGLIIYTSGTTGKPKGVVHTHSGMNAQVKMLSEAWGYTSNDRFLHCLPLHHVHGLFNCLLSPLFVGATVEFSPKFTASTVWKRWSRSYSKGGIKDIDAISVFTGVPSMYAYLLKEYRGMDEDAKEVAALAAQHLRLMMCGSSALPQPIQKEWELVTGHQLLERYGMTEFGMGLSNPYHGARKVGTVGKPLPGVQVRIVEDDAAVPGVGELQVKSPSMFKEYWQKPEVTNDAFTEDGYFKTGDSATIDDDGYYIILGRTSVDILKVAGYKLSALEIEAVLLEHPAIAECVILGLPDNYFGEVVCAVVVLKDEAKCESNGKVGSSLTLRQLRAWAKERLAPYKTPAKLKIWDAIPRNAMGKVNKKELKRLLMNPEAQR